MQSIILGSHPGCIIILSAVKIIIIMLLRFLYCKEDAGAFYVKLTPYHFSYNVLTIKMHNYSLVILTVFSKSLALDLSIKKIVSNVFGL